jgi:hypothetical protein
MRLNVEHQDPLDWVRAARCGIALSGALVRSRHASPAPSAVCAFSRAAVHTLPLPYSGGACVVVVPGTASVVGVMCGASSGIVG